MSTITKAIANEVAIKLTEKKQKEIKKLNSELNAIFYDMVVSKIPKEVLDAYKNHKEYFNRRSDMQMIGQGWNWRYISFGCELPYNKTVFEPNSKQSDILVKLKNTIEEKTDARNKLISEIEVALFSLRTYKRVEESFPEATPFLPEKITNVLAVNISDIRQKIKN